MFIICKTAPNIWDGYTYDKHKSKSYYSAVASVSAAVSPSAGASDSV